MVTRDRRVRNPHMLTVINGIKLALRFDNDGEKLRSKVVHQVPR